MVVGLNMLFLILLAIQFERGSWSDEFRIPHSAFPI